MKKTRIVAGALALALLAGCSGTKSPVAAADDLAYQAANIKRDTPIATVGDMELPFEQFLFWMCREVEYYGLGDQVDWSGFSTQLKADALEATQFYHVVAAKAEEMGITLTEEQEKDITREALAEQIGGEAALQEYLDRMCISWEGFQEMTKDSFLYSNLWDKMQEEGKLEVTAEDIEAYTENYIEEGGFYGAKHILISTRRAGEFGYEDFSEEEKAATLVLAQQMRQELREAGDSEEHFDRLMNEYSDDGRDEDGNLYYPDGYTTAYAGQMVPEFEAGALALEVGEISEPIQTSYGYHIILRIEPDWDTIKSQAAVMASTYCDEDYKFNQLVEEWMDGVEVVPSKIYDELVLKSFYDKLQEILNAKYPPAE